MSEEKQKRLIVEEIKRLCEIYKPTVDIGEIGLDEIADFILFFQKNYISKDKIIEKINQLKEIADEDNPDIFTKIDAYEELLEEK